ncbi:unnamed protein product [Calypogeia fissa]
MDCKILLAMVLLLLAPAVHGCVVFKATLGCPCDGDELFSVLVDNGIQMCTMKGPPSSDYMYHYTCYKANYTASFDTSTGVLHYGTDHGSWSIPTFSPAHGCWTTCQFGCSDQQCWVKTSKKECVSPSPSYKAPAASELGTKLWPPHKAPSEDGTKLWRGRHKSPSASPAGGYY